MAKWPFRKIGDIAERVAMGPFGSSIKVETFVPDGVPIISGQHLRGLRLADLEYNFVTLEHAERLANSNVQKGDVIFTHAGNIGQVAYIPMTARYERYVISQRQFYVRCDTDKIIPEFITYYFKTPEGQHKLLANTSSSGVPSIAQPVTYLRSIDVPVPPLNEQCAIAHILGALDDKIELNRQMNRTIEAIVQAIFKRWFINFEFPSEKGKPYKSSGGEMVDSELGKVPKCWLVATLGDICDITMGQSPPGETYNETGDGLPFYQGISDFGFRFPSRRVYCNAATRFADKNDVLLSVRAPVGSLNVAEERCAIGRGIAALRLKGKQTGYLYYLLRATQSGWIKFEAEGTVFGSVGKSDVHNFKILQPPKLLQDRFGLFVESIDKKVATNENETHTLTILRDSLLPHLMSGKIRVSIPQREAAIR